MKTSTLLMVLTAVLTIGISTAARAEDQMKGGPHTVHLLSQLKTQDDVDALKPGDTIAMACGKCKTVSVSLVAQDSKYKTKMLPGEKHLCPGCSGTIEVVGVGKGKHSVIKHVCSNCGDSSAFCCATKPGSAPTEGMGKN